MLAGIAFLTPAGDDAALAEAIFSARTADLSKNIDNGLRLAQSLSGRCLLPLFEQALLGDPDRECAAAQQPQELRV